MKVRGEVCSICEFPASGVYFGSVSCKACAAFFRRAIVEGKKYFCRQNNSCLINKNKRNWCRSCRLSKCFQVGMTKEEKQEIQQNVDHASTSADSLQGINNFDCPTLNGPIEKLLTSHRMYCNTEKSFYKLENNSNVFEMVDKPMPLNHEILSKLERASATLLASMLMENFELFRILPKTEKNLAFGPIASRLMALYSCWFTSINFSEPNNQKTMRHYGFYSPMDEPAKFFGKEMPDMDSVVSLLKANYRKVCHGAEKLVKLKITENEFVCIFSLIVFNQLDLMEFCSTEAQKSKQTILEYLQTFLFEKFGPKDGALRLAELINFQLDLEMISTSWTHTMITSVFHQHCSQIYLINNETIPPDCSINIL